jgi:hypothetical protein
MLTLFAKPRSNNLLCAAILKIRNILRMSLLGSTYLTLISQGTTHWTPFSALAFHTFKLTSNQWVGIHVLNFILTRWCVDANRMLASYLDWNQTCSLEHSHSGRFKKNARYGSHFGKKSQHWHYHYPYTYLSSHLYVAILACSSIYSTYSSINTGHAELSTL